MANAFRYLKKVWRKALAVSILVTVVALVSVPFLIFGVVAFSVFWALGELL